MEKLFYQDSHLTQFTACVTACVQTEKGWQVELDRTAFYPEGGGQACDTGTLGSVRVLDVREKGEKILHLCEAPLPVGEPVAGVIDWARRFDLMQQHTGEHIISGLIHAKFGYHNTGFHVGEQVLEVDFDGPISAAELAQIELEANAAVWQDIPLKCWVPEPEELKTVFYRTKRALDWPVRIVQVPGFDSCACCGVHVQRTGEVGLIKILSAAKFHQGVRLQMVCGQRAYRYTVRCFEENRKVSQAFSAPMEAIGAASQRMNETLAAEKARAAELEIRIFDGIAESYVNRENAVHFEADLQPGQVRVLADKIAGKVSGWAAVFSLSNGSYCLASRGADLRQLNRDMNEALCGRGGGKPNFQQGSVRSDRERIEEFFNNYGKK